MDTMQLTKPLLYTLAERMSVTVNCKVRSRKQKWEWNRRLGIRIRFEFGLILPTEVSNRFGDNSAIKSVRKTRPSTLRVQSTAMTNAD